MIRSAWLQQDIATIIVVLVVGLVIMLVLLSLGLKIGSMSATRQPGFIARNILLQKYEINSKDPMNLVYMVGRKAGFWGWLWSELKIAKSYEMHISSRFVMIMAPGIRDGIHAVIPMHSIVTVAYEYRRPIRALVIAIMFSFLIPITLIWHNVLATKGLIHNHVSSDYVMLLTFVSLIGATISYIYYMMRRAIRVLISAGDGFWGFQYLVGTVGSFQKAAETVNVIRNLIMDKHVELSSVAPAA